MVSLSGKDLDKFNDVDKWLKEESIIVTNSEILKMTLRVYHQIRIFEKGPLDAIGIAAIERLGFRKIVEKLREFRDDGSEEEFEELRKENEELKRRLEDLEKKYS